MTWNTLKPDEGADAPRAPEPVVTHPQLIDNPHAPEHVATDAEGFFLTPGLVHITLAAPRVDHRTSPGPVNRVVMARIVMPVEERKRLVLRRAPVARG